MPTKQLHSRQKQRGYRDKKGSVKHELIDRQVLAIHVAMVDKLLAYPEYHQRVFDTIEARLAQGKMRYGSYMVWFSLMDNIDQPEVFRCGVLEDSPRMRKLRRNTPLVGILTEDERQQALAKAASGEDDNLKSTV